MFVGCELMSVNVYGGRGLNRRKGDGGRLMGTCIQICSVTFHE